MAGNNSSQALVNLVKNFLSKSEWLYSFDEDRAIFSFTLGLREKLHRVTYLINVHFDDVVVYGFSPISADAQNASQMAEMAEFLSRANYGLKNGNFEFDFNDGEIRYKSFIDCDDLEPSDNVLRDSVHCCAAMLNRYFPGILDIVYYGAEAKEAIKKCENSRELSLRRSHDSNGDGSSIDLDSLLEELRSMAGHHDEGDDDDNSDMENADDDSDEETMDDDSDDEDDM